MKAKLYVRAALKNNGQIKLQTGMKPKHAALVDSYSQAIPTISFALVLDIDAGAFDAAEQVMAELEIAPTDIMVEAGVDV